MFSIIQCFDISIHECFQVIGGFRQIKLFTTTTNIKMVFLLFPIKLHVQVFFVMI